LSTQCELVTSENMYKIAVFAVKTLGFHGIVIRHDCLDTSSSMIKPRHFICREATFLFRSDVLRPVDKEDCGVLCYAKRNNLCIRNVIPDFPTPSEIDILLEKFDDHVVRSIIYESLMKYFEKDE
ncbi:MAG: hypothetical protein ACOCT9_03135, partial [archaeon]